MIYARLWTKILVAAAVLLSLLLLWNYKLEPNGSQGSLVSSNPPTQNKNELRPASKDKIVVIAKTKSENTDWVADELPDWQHAIYHVQDPDRDPRYTIPKRKGREATVYLSYIVDFYDHLPSTIAFVHAHADASTGGWHADAVDSKNANSLKALNLDFVQRHGYANLRCLPTPGCPGEMQLHRDPVWENKTAELAMPAAWAYLFDGEAPLPDVIGVPCCSQFAVSARQVRERPREQYVHFRQWLLDTSLDDYTAGIVFEYLWHIFFGREAVHCPDQKTCYCEQFGRC